MLNILGHYLLHNISIVNVFIDSWTVTSAVDSDTNSLEYSYSYIPHQASYTHVPTKVLNIVLSRRIYEYLSDQIISRFAFDTALVLASWHYIYPPYSKYR